MSNYFATPGFAWTDIIIIVALLFFSGFFSGLDLGLMGLTPSDLDILESGSKPNSTYATQIKPLRKHGNWLLCTLLLGNVCCNSFLAILLSLKFDSFIFGFITSVALIYVFGEIIPQLICSRYSLKIAAKLRYLIWPFMFLFGIISFPISLAIDKILGHGIEKIYDRKELRKLVDIKRDKVNIKDATAKMLQGALGLHDTQVSVVMTKWKDVFYLEENTDLTFDVLSDIFKSGHSRIPILSNKDNLGRIHIKGILYVKDLILIDPEDELPVQQIMNAFEYKVPPVIDLTDSLQNALTTFIQTTSHIAIVKEIKRNDELDNNIDFVGIITLEDVIEHILQTDLIDEHDNFVDHSHKKTTARLKKLNWDVLQQMFDPRTRFSNNLPLQELQAVYLFLSQSVKVFTTQHRRCSESAIKNLLALSQLTKINYNNNLDPYKDIYDNGLLLYQRDKKTEYFTLLLDGKVEIFAGRQGFRSELSRWSYLCPESLVHIEDSHVRGKPILDFVPDFTAKIIETSRILRIKLNDFKACLEGKFDGDTINTPRPIDSPPPFDIHHSFPNKHKSEPVLNLRSSEEKLDDIKYEKRILSEKINRNNNNNNNNINKLNGISYENENENEFENENKSTKIIDMIDDNDDDNINETELTGLKINLNDTNNDDIEPSRKSSGYIYKNIDKNKNKNKKKLNKNRKNDFKILMNQDIDENTVSPQN